MKPIGEYKTIVETWDISVMPRLEAQTVTAQTAVVFDDALGTRVTLTGAPIKVDRAELDEMVKTLIATGGNVPGLFVGQPYLTMTFSVALEETEPPHKEGA